MSTGESEYRIARLRDRLAREEVAELGVRIEVRGAVVLLTGTVPTADRRDEILRIAEAELADLPVRADLQVACADPPDRPEELL
ncbi:BON domain-containing protein [Streptomyces sp. NPDC002773]|uniref:BON domain-containing protein n=1 Tax=unclassified Streptomyces TaxID=2593676 RepID=UPI003328E5CB